MKKNDIILITVIIAIAILSFWGIKAFQKYNSGGPAVAAVTIDDKTYGEYPLSEDIEEKIELPDGNYNILIISDGYARVVEASCPDKICVHHSPIRYQGETIVCLPNKLVVEIKGGEDNGLDTSTH
ncbi:NusG domain II-containing protein [Butyrivibrio sp. JL13D10]|uniref:NusG domain II-containing protein n=1 Tax=Butyrivibrio sp. JL13D10 TaxID=3236815 RepID=UPI0038B5C795